MTMWTVIQQVLVQVLVLLPATQGKNTVSDWPDLCAGQLEVTGDGRGEQGWRSSREAMGGTPSPL